MPIEVALASRQLRVEALRAELKTLRPAGRPLTLEIGCGHGHYLTAYAAAHPDEYCIGVDLQRERLARAARKSARLSLPNLAWLKGDAVEVLAAWPEDLRINRHVFLLFPDPWPKRRHWKNRLVQADFLTELAARCASGTRLCFRTDHAPYFEAAAAAIRSHGAWSLEPAGAWPYEEPTVFQTRALGFQSFVARRG